MSDVHVAATLKTYTCPSCYVVHAIPEEMEERMLQKRGPGGRQAYCPNGHTWHFTGKSDAVRLVEAREELERSRRSLQATRELLHHEERRAASLKGHVTRKKKELARAKAGVCPVDGCRRHFQNLGRHMKTKHPGYTP